jgi:DNA-binding transcriptional regulator GbsR (MarR family)
MNSGAELKLRTLLSKIAEVRGLNAVEGSILSILLLTPNPLTQRDIAIAVDRSHSTISRALQRMVKRGIVKWNRRSGSREMLFSLTSKHPQELILSGIWGWLNANIALRKELVVIINELDSGSDQGVRQIASALIEAIDYASTLLEPIIKKIEINQQ